MMTSLILKQPITGAIAWKGSEICNEPSWVTQLDVRDIANLESVLQHVMSKGLRFPHFEREDFPIGSLKEKIANIGEELENGKGFLLIRGLDLDRYQDEEINILYYGLGLHLGTPVCQNPKGDLLGQVMNVGDLEDKNTRVYETNAYLPYHTDPSDVFGLLCIRKGKAGGLNSLVSVATIYNEILKNHPELLGIFYRPTYYAHLGEDLPSLSPIFSYHEGKLACRYLRQYIELGADVMNLPLSRVEISALDTFDTIAHDPELRLDMMLEPGDMVFANNYAIMHSRTGFEDYDLPEQKRKLLRLWVKMANARSLAPDFPGRNGFPPPENRAGC